MFYNLVLKVTINDAVNVTTPSVKSIPYWAAHHCMGYIWSNPPPPPPGVTGEVPIFLDFINVHKIAFEFLSMLASRSGWK